MRHFLAATALLSALPAAAQTGINGGIGTDLRDNRTRIDRERGCVEVLGLWWEDGFVPRRADGFVDAMRDAFRAYLRFAGAERIDWAPQLRAERRLFLVSP